MPVVEDGKLKAKNRFCITIRLVKRALLRFHFQSKKIR